MVLSAGLEATDWIEEKIVHLGDSALRGSFVDECIGRLTSAD
jgi:hypothetical protein